MARPGPTATAHGPWPDGQPARARWPARRVRPAVGPPPRLTRPGPPGSLPGSQAAAVRPDTAVGARARGPARWARLGFLALAPASWFPPLAWPVRGGGLAGVWCRVSGPVAWARGPWADGRVRSAGARARRSARWARLGFPAPAPGLAGAWRRRFRGRRRPGFMGCGRPDTAVGARVRRSARWTRPGFLAPAPAYPAPAPGLAGVWRRFPGPAAWGHGPWPAGRIRQSAHEPDAPAAGRARAF